MKKRLLSLLLVVCMVVPLLPTVAFAAGTGTSADPIIVYRNPEEDPAGTELSILTMGLFDARTSTQQAWKDQIIAAANVTGADDVHYYVSTMNLGYVSITQLTSVIDAGNWFGWNSVNNGTDTERRVIVVDRNGNELTSDLVVRVKSYVDVTWDIDGTKTASKVSLNTTLASAAPEDTAKAHADTLTAATGGGITYIFAGWDSDGDGVAEDLSKVIDVTDEGGCVAAETVDGKTYKAVYTSTAKEYTVTWVNEGTTIETDTVKHGDIPVYDGETPAKAADAQYTYTFAGWTPAISAVTGDITYTATYTTAANEYTVRWVNDNGDLLETDTVEYGTTPTYDGETPEAKKTEAGLNYTFTGWTPEISAVTGDITYTATYTTAENVYTVKFDTSGGSAVADASVGHGDLITANTVTTREGYRFNGWTLDGEAFDLANDTVTSDITLVATWVKQVTVTFDMPDGFALSPITGDVGMKVTLTEADLGRDYQFDGWFIDGTKYNAGDEITVDEDIVVYVLYVSYVDISFYANGGNGTMTAVRVLAGHHPLPANEFTRSGYAFKGWATSAEGAVEYADMAYVTVEENLALYAVWEKVPAIATAITVGDPEVTVPYGGFTSADLLDAIAPVVTAKGEKVNGAVVTINDITANDVGSYTVTLSYAGERVDDVTEYAPSTATATVVIEKAVASVVVSSQTVKYGTAVADPFKVNCETIDVLAGLDAADETYLVGDVQIAMSQEMMLLLALATADSDIDLNDLTIEDLKTILKLAEGQNETIDTVIAKLKPYEESFDKLVDALKKVQANLPMDSELKIRIVSELELPENIGLYMICSISADDNYTTDMDAGYLIITPNGVKANLAWNQSADNYVVTLNKLNGFDFGATASVVGGTLEGALLDDVMNHVEYIFVGVDANGDLLLDRTADANAVELGFGAYAQVAYVANWGNEMYYAEPLVRPVIVSPNVADVAILDKNGNENYAQVFTYDGTAKGVTVTVNGKTDVDGLTVKYIGSDTTVDGWYRDEAPTDAGVYTVVALYTESDANGELVTVGTAVGVLVIEPADADVALEDDDYCYDGEERFAKITNDALDYITVAIDRENNIAYVNLPEDTEEHIDRLVSMLPAELEAKIENFLAKYENFDGDIQTSTIKKELNDIIKAIVEADLTSAAAAKTEQLVDAVIEELKANENVQAAIAKLKAELETIKTEIASEIPDEIEARLIEYVKAVVTTSDDSVEIDTAKIKADIMAKIDELESQLPAIVVAEIREMANEVIAAVEAHIDADAIESKISELVSVIETIDSEDAETLIKYVIGAAYGIVDLSEVESLVNEVYAKIEARGYVDYVKNMIKSIAGIYGGDIDTTEVEASVDALVAKIEEKLASGNVDADDLTAIEGYLDDILVSLTTVVDQIPDGTIVFGKNPSEIGEYDCYAINISANYKAEFAEATLIIHDHKPAEAVKENEVKETCTAEGSYDEVVYCEVCGEELSREAKTVPAAGHQYDKGVVTDSTCNDAGNIRYTCTVCGDYYDVAIDPKGHTAEPVEGKAPTCTETGLTDGTKCSVCGVAIEAQQTIDANGHTEEPVLGKAPTCTEEGLTDGTKCSVCGETVTAQEPIDANGHTEEPVEGKAPTCTETGLTDGTKCSVCGETVTAQEPIDANGHTPAEAVKENEVKETCTAEGSYDEVVYCEVCGEELSRKTVTVPVTDHPYDDGVVTDSTCNDAGNIRYTCTVCGDYYDVAIDPKGHTAEPVEGKAPTCTEEGLTDGTKCSVCGATIEAQETISANGHTEETVEGKAPTCTEEGLTDGKKCSVCGETLTAQETIPANGHTEETVDGKAPTCTEEGLTDGKKCSVCGETLTAQEVIKATGHTPAEEVKENVVEATDTTAGSYDLVVYCSVCGEELSRKTVTVPAVLPPQTGDSSKMDLWLFLLPVSCAALLALLFVPARSRKEEE